MTEIIDIITADDIVTGQISREESERLGYLRRFVHIFVLRNDGSILFQQRHHSKKSCPLQLDAAAGGHVMTGETYLESAQRELEEELGFVGPLKEIGRITGEQKLGMLFIYHFDDTQAITILEEEIACCDWLTIQEMDYLVDRHPYFIAGGTLSSRSVYKQFLGN